MQTVIEEEGTSAGEQSSLHWSVGMAGGTVLIMAGEGSGSV